MNVLKTMYTTYPLYGNKIFVCVSEKIFYWEVTVVPNRFSVLRKMLTI